MKNIIIYTISIIFIVCIALFSIKTAKKYYVTIFKDGDMKYDM